MTVQSSFLIRCSFSAAGEPSPGKAFYIHHVQTGAEFGSASLGEAVQWMSDQNVRYLADRLEGRIRPAADGSAEEEAQ